MEIHHTKFAGEVQPEPFSTFLGEVTYFGLNNFGAVYVDEDFENNYLNMDQHYFSEAQILILNHEGEVLKHFVYDPTWNRMKNVE